MERRYGAGQKSRRCDRLHGWLGRGKCLWRNRLASEGQQREGAGKVSPVEANARCQDLVRGCGMKRLVVLRHGESTWKGESGGHEEETRRRRLRSGEHRPSFWVAQDNHPGAS